MPTTIKGSTTGTEKVVATTSSDLVAVVENRTIGDKIGVELPTKEAGLLKRSLTSLAGAITKRFSRFMPKEDERQQHPENPKKPGLFERFHVRWLDPFQWMEKDSAERKDWLTAQNNHTYAELAKFTEKATVQGELEKMLFKGESDVPVQAGERLFALRRAAEDKQKKLVEVDSEGKTKKVLINPIEMFGEDTAAVKSYVPNEDGSKIAFEYSIGGRDETILRIMDTNTGEMLEEVIPKTRQSAVVWREDGTGFWYRKAYEKDQEGKEIYKGNFYYHKLGEPLDSDVLVLENKDPRVDHLYISGSTKDGYLIIGNYHGYSAVDLSVVKVDPANPVINQSELKPLFVGNNNLMGAIVSEGYVYMRTDKFNPNFDIRRVKLGNLEDINNESKWEVISSIDNPRRTIESMAISGDYLILRVLENASSKLERISLKDPSKVDVVPLPANIGTISQLSGDKDSPYMYYKFTSFTHQPTVMKVNVQDLAEPQENLDTELGLEVLEDIEISQIVTTSKDGTEIPMFIVKKKGVEQNGQTPTLMYGYGGFNIPKTPWFWPLGKVFMENGGILAVPSIRGGGEFGSDWHKQGMLENKQNVFDDFTAAGDELVKQGITDNKHLAIIGGSNGGLLIGATITQRPDLAGVAVCQVPLLDLTYYHTGEYGGAWALELGNTENPDHFKFLMAYSPYHHVRNGVAYPSTLFLTGEGDDRVYPSHAMKMTAAMQEATSSSNPIMIRVERETGHGADTSVNLVVKEYTEILSFLMLQLGMDKKK